MSSRRLPIACLQTCCPTLAGLPAMSPLAVMCGGACLFDFNLVPKRLRCWRHTQSCNLQVAIVRPPVFLRGRLEDSRWMVPPQMEFWRPCWQPCWQPTVCHTRSTPCHALGGMAAAAPVPPSKGSSRSPWRRASRCVPCSLPCANTTISDNGSRTQQQQNLPPHPLEDPRCAQPRSNPWGPHVFCRLRSWALDRLTACSASCCGMCCAACCDTCCRAHCAACWTSCGDVCRAICWCACCAGRHGHCFTIPLPEPVITSLSCLNTMVVGWTGCAESGSGRGGWNLCMQKPPVATGFLRVCMDLGRQNTGAKSCVVERD